MPHTLAMCANWRKPSARSHKIAVEMAFKCPACRRNTLKIHLTLELPPGASDETQVQTLKCEACGFRGIALYEESRRGSLDSESFRHGGYEVRESDMERVVDALLRCPAPGERYCQCETHLTWAKSDWSSPEKSGMTVKRRFRMDLAD